MKHRRWVEDGFFPSNKYAFSAHLQRVGDWVTTSPLSKKDTKRFRDAAHSWAWHKGWKVSCRSLQVAEDKWETTCKLISKVQGRDFL
jgi:hypothetical protein